MGTRKIHKRIVQLGLFWNCVEEKGEIMVLGQSSPCRFTINYKFIIKISLFSRTYYKHNSFKPFPIKTLKDATGIEKNVPRVSWKDKVHFCLLLITYCVWIELCERFTIKIKPLLFVKQPAVTVTNHIYRNKVNLISDMGKRY